ncbi:hypothetical protein CK203_091617 [Vitis vinifera]|uniref:Retrotransposon gag domain-containing protein n=1 Tax=Vitis vinifera TaxID=29760 RepID=A0A438EZX4_VITVI|nr:hypothetical protein CK203_091617 [Vitis vinifera]
MDSQIVTVDQFAEAMASIQKAIASLGRRIDGQQAQQVPPPVGAQYDPTVPPPPPPSQSVPQAMPFTLHSQTGVAPPPIIVPTSTSEDHMLAWIDLTSLPAKFRMPDIERYTGIGCPRLHLRLYSTVMRAHGLDEPQMITFFPLSLSGMAQRWFASLEASRRRTWDDLAQEFLRQFSFNTVVDVSRRELEALRQRSDESVSSFISRWRGKIAEIIDRPSERDQIQMVLRSLQPRIARHVVGAPFTDFGSLVMALYDVEDGISRGLWIDSSPSDIKGKKPFVGSRPADVSVIGSSNQRPLRRHQPIPSFPSLIRPMHLISTSHGHLVQLMIKHILRRLWLCLIMPPRALRDPRFPTWLQDSHAMLLSSLRDPLLLIPDPELSRLPLPLL